MNIKCSRRRAALLLLSIGCLAVAGKGQAQTVPPPVGPVRLDGPPALSQIRRGPIYLLSLVQVADTKPAKSVWLLQKEIVQPDQPIEVQETAYKSLNAVSLRGFISKLPKGAEILCTTSYLPGPDPAIRIGMNSSSIFNDFAALCRSKGVQLKFGIPF